MFGVWNKYWNCKWCLRVIALHSRTWTLREQLVSLYWCRARAVKWARNWKILKILDALSDLQEYQNYCQSRKLGNSQPRHTQKSHRPPQDFLRHPGVTCPGNEGGCFPSSLLCLIGRKALPCEIVLEFLKMSCLFVEMQCFSNTVFWPTERGSQWQVFPVDVLPFLRQWQWTFCGKLVLVLIGQITRDQHTKCWQGSFALHREHPKLPPAYCWWLARHSLSTEVTETSG